MVGWVPVLGEDDVLEVRGESVDDGDDCVSIGNGEPPAGAEVALDVDEEQKVGGLDWQWSGHECLRCLVYAVEEISPSYLS